MNHRLAEIEAKRRRLNEIRLQKKMREEGRNSLAPFSESGVGNHARPTLSRDEINDLLIGIGIGPAVVDEQKVAISSELLPKADFPSKNEIAAPADASDHSPVHLGLLSLPKNNVSIPPKPEVIVYSKTVQTDDNLNGEFSLGSQDFDDSSVLDANSIIAPSVYDERFNKIFDDNVKHDVAVADDSTLILSSVVPETPAITEEERAKILQDDEFVRFVRRQSRIFERIIAEEGDIYADYTALPPEKVESGDLLVLSRELYDGASTAGRMVRALDQSTYYPELLAVAYNHSADVPLATESVVNVWNTHYRTAPELTFHSSAEITSMIFDPFQSNIIIGGCYSGQICVWDTRTNKRYPVLRTPLSVLAHTQPLLGMRMVGSQNAHDLVTLSTDGRLCKWTVDKLTTPIESTDLHTVTNAEKQQSKQVAALSMSFFHSDVQNFVIGGEDHALYVANRCGQNGGIDIRIDAAHDMPITNVDLHHVLGGANDFSSLCLSCSADFSVKLWDLKDTRKKTYVDHCMSEIGPENLKQLLLLNLQCKHMFYVVDVQWSPTHPAVFVSASADGIVNLWNLNQSVETPVATVDTGVGIRKILWSKNGQRLSVGSAEGRVFLYDVHENLYTIRVSDFDQLSNTLVELKAARIAGGLTD